MARSSVATDDFNRTDEDPLSGSGNWADLNFNNSRVALVSNKIQGTHAAHAIARWVGTGTFTDDQYSSLVVATIGGFTQSEVGVIARASGDTNANRDCYSYRVKDANPPETRLVKVVNGTETELNSSTSVSWSNGDRIEIECEGTTIRGLKNGTSQYSTTDSSLTTGKPGVHGYNAGTLYSAGVDGDSWEGGNITAGGQGSLLGSNRNRLIRVA
jgi:hypothetical protein